MALIVEDGTGKPDAESYISVAAAITYHAARGNAAWAAIASDTIREQLLRKATEYMMQNYRGRWAGSRVGSVQALDWPRAWVPIPDLPYGYGSFPSYVPPTVIPVEVQRACAELALMANTGDLAPNLDRKTRREKVDVIEVEYADDAAEYVRYRAVDMMLRTYLVGSPVSTVLVRA